MNTAVDVSAMTAEEFTRCVCKTIAREYGNAGLLRFLEEQLPKRGNYTEERKQWAKMRSVDEIMDQIERQK